MSSKCMYKLWNKLIETEISIDSQLQHFLHSICSTTDFCNSTVWVETCGEELGTLIY